MKELTQLQELLIFLKATDFGDPRITKAEKKMFGFLGTVYQDVYVEEYLEELQSVIKEKTPKKTFFQKIRSKFRRIIKRFKS